MLAACTIVSPNYLPFARTLAASWREHHPDAPFFVLLVADLPPTFTLPDPPPGSQPEPFTAIPVSAIGIPNLRVEAMKYDILELNTNVKPAFLQHLFATRPAVDHLLYLDPDIRVYAPLTPVTDLLSAGAPAVLTPHITSPITDTRAPSEQDMLYNGTYNLGFIGLRRSPVADNILAWWNRRCLDLGFSEGRTGLFVDQKWMNLLPGLFPDVAILRDAGCNMAYWNLHERNLLAASGHLTVQNPNSPPVPLRFFHFSGLAPDESTVVSRNTDRFTLPERPDLQLLFATYIAELRRNRNPATDSIPYGFDRLSDNTAVTRLARRLFAAHADRFTGQGTHAGPGSFSEPNGYPDPFDVRGPFAAFARRLRLVAGPATPPKNTWKEFNPRDRRVQAIHRLLRAALRILGPNRYELLMRYLAFIAVLRHQGAFLQPTAADLDPSPRSGRTR